MSNHTQYAHTFFLETFHTGVSPKTLKRLHFSKNVSESAPYNEAWLQHLIVDQPGLLPVSQIEPAFADLIPICVELPVRSGGSWTISL